MIWGYYDESGEYADGKLVNMTIGSCMAPFENWIAFEREWREALAKEGISAFHMTDFEAWVPPFDFKFTDGGRDKEKHNRSPGFEPTHRLRACRSVSHQLTNNLLISPNRIK